METNIISLDEKCVTYEQDDGEERCIGCTCWPEDVDYGEE